MYSILEYVQNTKVTFSDQPFCEGDSLVLGQLCYVYFDNVVPAPSVQARVPLQFLVKEPVLSKILEGARVPHLNRQLLLAMAESPRFSDMEIGGYENRIDLYKEEQFSAVTFFFGDNGCIAFRGTDTYYVGWKESLNLASRFPIPSQLSGAAYVSNMAKQVKGKLYLCGHSKGGNTAAYALGYCSKEAYDKIEAAYSLDGPGFPAGVLSHTARLRMKRKLKKTIPQASLVGGLLQDGISPSVISSKAFWFLQHDPYTWQLSSQGAFLQKESVSLFSCFLNRRINRWISVLSTQQLEQLSHGVYQVLCSFGGTSFNDLPPQWRGAILRSLRGMATVKPCVYKDLFYGVALFLFLPIVEKRRNKSA